MRALIIKEPWASKVVLGEKTMELRSRRTTKIGQEIYIAKAGTKTLIGRVTIEKCVQLTVNDYLWIKEVSSNIMLFAYNGVSHPNHPFSIICLILIFLE